MGYVKEFLHLFASNLLITQPKKISQLPSIKEEDEEPEPDFEIRNIETFMKMHLKNKIIYEDDNESFDE